MPHRRYQLNPFYDPSWNSGPEDPAVYKFHRSIPEYVPTPLLIMPGLAARLGVKNVYLKDESHRFGLNAFKVLGASWAIHRLMSRASNDTVFCTATDGNHGRAVAWTARKLKHEAVIYVPRNTARARIESIQKEGARVIVVDGNYDRAVERAAIDSAIHGWQVVSDTGYDGYLEIPELIMAGYSTLFVEIDEQIPDLAITPPDVIVVQAGVGGLLCAATRHYRQPGRKHRPTIVSVEPVEADCLLESISSNNGEPRTSHGNLGSIMAGLNAGTVSLAAWPTIRVGTNFFLSIDDDYARRAIRLLFFPVQGDPSVMSGETGAAGLAGLLALCREPDFRHAKEEIGILPHTTMLLLNTEGVTDPDNFARIIGTRL